ncbi:unnamed protein product [Moneuplotes crassus]|uniref:Aurora kinase n=1 Tax=Euplotes crassus TaxID=5936 RepID=A0AAD1U6L4_EUPCR|nr:unnamed protein product [Moneuplotes crassus]
MEFTNPYLIKTWCFSEKKKSRKSSQEEVLSKRNHLSTSIRKSNKFQNVPSRLFDFLKKDSKNSLQRKANRSVEPGQVARPMTKEGLKNSNTLINDNPHQKRVSRTHNKPFNSYQFSANPSCKLPRYLSKISHIPKDTKNQVKKCQETESSNPIHLNSFNSRSEVKQPKDVTMQMDNSQLDEEEMSNLDPQNFCNSSLVSSRTIMKAKHQNSLVTPVRISYVSEEKAPPPPETEEVRNTSKEPAQEEDDNNWEDISDNSGQDDVQDASLTEQQEAEILFQKTVRQSERGMQYLQSQRKLAEITKNRKVRLKSPKTEEVKFPRKIFDPEEWSLENFEIGRPLARGHSGYCLLVRERITKYPFVLKMIFKKQLSRSQRYLKSLRREIEIHSRLKHPNILSMHGWFKDHKRVFIILEYCAEGDLFTYMTEQPGRRFPEEVSANYIKQIAEALLYLHSKNIIHRDIKPENILVDGDDIKLGDFGLSIHSPSNRRKSLGGTADYMSPEMLQNKEYDSRIDIWSLGILAYELSSGEAPFYSIDKLIQGKKIKLGQFQMKSYFTESLKDLITKLLKVDPQERISIEEVLTHPWIVSNTFDISELSSEMN